MICTFGRRSRRRPDGVAFQVEGTTYAKAWKYAFMERSSVKDGWNVRVDQFKASLRHSGCPTLQPCPSTLMVFDINRKE